MSEDIPIERHAAALRTCLTGAPPTEGFHLVEVRVAAGETAVVFQWQRDPHTFLIRFGRGSVGPFAPEPGAKDDAVVQGWCEDVYLWLMEELDTGYLARATRHREGDLIVLTEPPRRTPTGDAWVSDVPQFAPEVRLSWLVRLRVAPRLLIAWLRGRPAYFSSWGPPEDAAPGDGLTDGDWLVEAGLDPVRVRTIRGEGRLLAWLQAWGGAAEGAWGQCAVATTRDSQVAAIEVLEVASGAAPQTRQELVDAAVRAAADAGARTVLVPTGAGDVHPVDTALC